VEDSPHTSAASSVRCALVDALNERYYVSYLGGTQLTSNRFRQVPTFGLSTIRSFRDNISEMKRLAARDYEDLLQVTDASQNHWEVALTPGYTVCNPRV